MPNEITSAILGQLTQDRRFPEWWTSTEKEIPFLENKKFQITFMDFAPQDYATFIQEADRALNNFFQLSENYKEEIAGLLFRQCQDFISAVGEDGVSESIRNMQSKREVWNFVHFQNIYVQRRRRRDKDIYIALTGNCEWDEEHGLQLVFRQGRKLTRISDQDGHITESDAYNIPDDEDKLLAAF